MKDRLILIVLWCMSAAIVILTVIGGLHLVLCPEPPQIMVIEVSAIEELNTKLDLLIGYHKQLNSELRCAKINGGYCFENCHKECTKCHQEGR